MNGIIVVIHAMPIVEIALVLPHHHAPIVDPLTTSWPTKQVDIAWVNVQLKDTSPMVTYARSVMRHASNVMG